MGKYSELQIVVNLFLAAIRSWLNRGECKWHWYQNSAMTTLQKLKSISSSVFFFLIFKTDSVKIQFFCIQNSKPVFSKVKVYKMRFSVPPKWTFSKNLSKVTHLLRTRLRLCKTFWPFHWFLCKEYPLHKNLCIGYLIRCLINKRMIPPPTRKVVRLEGSGHWMPFALRLIAKRSSEGRSKKRVTDTRLLTCAWRGSGSVSYSERKWTEWRVHCNRDLCCAWPEAIISIHATAPAPPPAHP